MPEKHPNTKFFNNNGGDKRTIASGGELEGQSGGLFDAQEGFQFFLVDTTIFVKHIDQNGRQYPLQMPKKFIK